MVGERIVNSVGRGASVIASSSVVLLMLCVCGEGNAVATPAQAKNSVPTSEWGGAVNASHAKKKYGNVFGLGMGMSVDALQNELSFKAEKGMYVGLPPEPSDLFNKYGVVATRKSGACSVTAMTSDIEINDPGTQIKRQVDEIAEVLKVKYGVPTRKVDFIREGGGADDPSYWSMHLEHESVSYGYVWTSGENGLTLPNDLDSIAVTAVGLSMHTARANLQYNFKNAKSCEEDIRIEKSSKL